MNTISGKNLNAALALVNRILAEFGIAGISDLPFSVTGSATECAIARGLKPCSTNGVIIVGNARSIDANGKVRRVFRIENPIGYPVGTIIERFLPPECEAFIAEFDSIGGEINPQEKCPDPFMGRIPDVGSAKANACGCALCLGTKNPSLEQMIESIALHGKPGSVNAKGALTLPDDFGTVEVKRETNNTIQEANNLIGSVAE